MESPEQLGRMALRMKPEDQKHFKEASMVIRKEESMAKNRKLANKQEGLSAKYRRQQTELTQRGFVPNIFTHESLIRGIFMGIILLISSVGEFIFAQWMLVPFMEYWQSCVVALTIVILSFEGVNNYLASIRKRKPKLDDQIFLVFSILGFLLLILLIFFGAEVRQTLFQTSATVNASTSPDETVKAASAFYGTANASFVWLMVTLSAAITIIGGMAYHDVKNRIMMAFTYRKLYRDIEESETALQTVNDQQADSDEERNSFEARFDQGLLKAQAEQLEAEQVSATIENTVRPASQQSNAQPANNQTSADTKLDTFIVISPLVIILIAVLLFFVFKSVARADETIVFLDMSRSMESNDYTNKQTEFQKNVNGIESFIGNYLMPGGKLRVLGITENSFSNPYLLLEGQVSTNKGAFGEVVARDKLNLVQAWKKLNLKPIAKMTDIFGALNLGSNLFNHRERKKQLILFSDMRHYTREIDLETPGVINKDSEIKRVTEKGCLAPLPDVKIWCLGVHSAGKEPIYWRSLNAFWVEYFRQAKASDPIVFSMERRLLKNE